MAVTAGVFRVSARMCVAAGALRVSPGVASMCVAAGALRGWRPFIPACCYSSAHNLPVIRISRRTQTWLEKQQKQSETEPRTAPKSRKLLITSRRREYNQTTAEVCRSWERPRLVSGGWKHRKSQGDFFVINRQRDQRVWPETEDTFYNLDLDSKVVSSLNALNIKTPTWVQKEAIPMILKGNDVLCASETGSGKTLLYLLPIIHKLLNEDQPRSDNPGNLILVPSKELATQVASVASAIGSQIGVTVHCLGGGLRHRLLKNRFSVDILVSTPGILWKAVKSDKLSLTHLRCIVLDEVDTLFDKTFSELVEKILVNTSLASHSNKGRLATFGPGGKSNSEAHGTATNIYLYDETVAQNIQPQSGSGSNCLSAPLPSVPLLSVDMFDHKVKPQLVAIGATFPKNAGQILNKIMDLRRICTVKSKKLHYLMPHVQQTFKRLKGMDKVTELMDLLKKHAEKLDGSGVLIFCNNSSTVNWLGYILDDHSIKHARLHGSIPATMRLDIFQSFQKCQIDVLVCTDLASRGIDSVRVGTVVNFDFPPSLEDYIHRAGRVGRVGSVCQGTVVSFVTHPWDVEVVQKIETAARKKICLPDVESNLKYPAPERSLVKKK